MEAPKIWLLTPLFGTIFGFLFLSFVMLGKIWIPSKMSSQNRIVNTIILGGNGIIGVMSSYYGILLCTTVLKVLFGGIFTLNNFWFYLMGLILMTLLAGILLMSGVFKAPTWATIFSFLAIVVFMLSYFEFYLEFQSIDKIELVTIPMLLSIGVFLATTVLTVPFRIMKSKQKGEADIFFEFSPLWDVSLQVEKWVNIKTLGILWLFFAVETFLLLEGLTLLYWVGFF